MIDIEGIRAKIVAGQATRNEILALFDVMDKMESILDDYEMQPWAIKEESDWRKEIKLGSGN